MRKHIYRAQSVKRANLEQLARQLPLDRLVVGTDCAKETPFGVLMNGSAEVLKTLKWDSLEESRDLANWLSHLLVESVEVVMEPSGSYGDPWRWLCYQAHLPVYRVKPKQVKDSREIYDGVPSSHDAKSAAIVAWLHLLRRSELWEPRSERRRRLSSAVQTMTIHELSCRQGQNRLEGRLARFWPELTQALELDSVTLLELLSAYGDPAEVAHDGQRAGELMKQVGHALKDEKIAWIVDSAARTIGVPMIEAEREALRHLASETRRQQKAWHRAKKSVVALSEGDPLLQRQGEVVGLVTAAVLEVKIGPPQAYESPESYLKAAGLNLKIRSSGKRKGQLAITKRGPGQARQYLHLATLRWLKKEPIVRTWYEQKVQRDGGKLKKRALTALTRKLTRGLWWVGQGQPFDLHKLFDTERLGLT